LNIVVCVKQVPDSAAKVVVEDGQVSWGDAPLVLNPWDEYAVEAALVQSEASGSDVTVISVGGESAQEALKTSLAMGCKQAVLVADPALEQADSQAVAHVLAAAIQKIGDVGMAFFGKQAIDGDMGVTAAQTARVLGWSILSGASTVEAVGDAKVRVERAVEEGRQVVEGQLYCGMRITSKARGSYFLGGQAATDLVTPLKYANAHTSIFLQVHGKEQCLITTPNYYHIKGLISHQILLNLYHFYIYISLHAVVPKVPTNG